MRKKRLLILLCCLLAVAMLVGCAAETVDTPEETPATQPEETAAPPI